MTESRLRQAYVSLVEDETLIRIMIAGMVEGPGHTVVADHLGGAAHVEIGDNGVAVERLVGDATVTVSPSHPQQWSV